VREPKPKFQVSSSICAGSAESPTRQDLDTYRRYA
jgi:hypothetical protein